MSKDEKDSNHPITDALKDLKDFVNERLKNPFFASLAVFFVVFNWKSIFYLFFSDTSIENRFEKITTEYSSHFTVYILPVVFAFIYYFVRDLFFNYIETNTSDNYIKRKTSETEKRKKEIDLEISIVQKLNQLEDERARNVVRIEMQQKIDGLTAEIDTLKDQQKTEQLKLINSQDINSIFKQTLDYIFSLILNSSDVKEFSASSDKNYYLKSANLLIEFLTDRNGLSSDEIKDGIIKLEGSGLIEKFATEFEGFKQYRLTGLGAYIILRHLFTQEFFKNNKINFLMDSSFNVVQDD